MIAALLVRAAVGLLGGLWWWGLPVRRAVARDQLRQSLPEVAPGPTLRRAVGSAAVGYLELLLGRRAHWTGTAEARRRIATTGGICLAGHGGAWDLAMVCCATEVPLTVFVRAPSSRLAAAALAALRRRHGADLELLPPAGSMGAAAAALARGRMVVFVQDQRHNRGLPVPFFGRPAWTSAGFAALAHRSGAPLFGAWQRRDPDGRVRGEMRPLDWPVAASRAAAVAALTARSQAWTEAQIRRWPADWWWLHKRWKRPPGAGCEAAQDGG